MADRRVIILGCGGFVGSHLTERLLADGRFEITGFDVSDVRLARNTDGDLLTGVQERSKSC